jgi:hypothetical protein
LGNFPGLKELVSNPGRATKSENGKERTTPLQKQPERVSEFYAKLTLRMQQGAPATITFFRDARVGEDAYEEVVDVDPAWSREDIEEMFTERIDGFEILAAGDGGAGEASTTKTEL